MPRERRSEHVTDHHHPADDLRSFRQALGSFPTGVTVVSAAAGERRVGVTANSQRFCTPAADKFADLDVDEGAGGCPVLPGCAAVFECRRVAEYDGDDHVILIGEVERYAISGSDPLVFRQGGYHVAHPCSVPSS